MQYQKKPVVVEAFQWTGDETQEHDPVWIVEAIEKGDVTFSEKQMFIRTLEGVMTANKGDYIIRGVKGELYPCKPDIFQQTYDPSLRNTDPEMEEIQVVDTMLHWAGIPVSVTGTVRVLKNNLSLLNVTRKSP